MYTLLKEHVPVHNEKHSVMFLLFPVLTEQNLSSVHFGEKKNAFENWH